MSTVAAAETKTVDNETTNLTVKNIFNSIPRGKPKSGRTWKSVRTERYSKVKQVKRFKTSWAEKMFLKDEKKKIKEFQEHLKGEKVKEKELRRLRTEEKKKQKLLNQRKSEITQPNALSNSWSLPQSAPDQEHKSQEDEKETTTND